MSSSSSRVSGTFGSVSTRGSRSGITGRLGMEVEEEDSFTGGDG